MGFPGKISLEKYTGPASRYTCPECGKPRAFARYVYQATGQPVGPAYGRCNREEKCGYHLRPDTPDNEIRDYTPPRKKEEYKPSLISREIVGKSLSEYERNNFVVFLTERFGADRANEVIRRYFIGTSRYWLGATVFWQFDAQGNARAGKVMLYHPETGKRVKEPFNHIQWVHAIMKEENYQLKQCLFGSHLLSGSTKPIAVVESEKTAIIASIYLDSFTWLATGGVGNFGLIDQLAGKRVILYPDLKATEKWAEKAEKYGFQVSYLLEDHATPKERSQGLDLADYLLKFEPEDFTPPTEPKPITAVPATTQQPEYQPLADRTPPRPFVPVEREDWTKEVAELEAWFLENKPEKPVRIKESTIRNPAKYIESNLIGARTYNGKKRFYCFVSRLKELKTQLINNERIDTHQTTTPPGMAAQTPLYR